MAEKFHLLKTGGPGEEYEIVYRSYCGRLTMQEGLFLARAQMGDICKNCIRCRIAYKRKVRSS